MNLKGKVTVIAGGEGPLGREVSKKFLAEGAKVFIGWYAEKEWEEAKGLLSAYKGQYAEMRVDATKEDQVQKLMQKAKDTFGPSMFCFTWWVWCTSGPWFGKQTVRFWIG